MQRSSSVPLFIKICLQWIGNNEEAAQQKEILTMSESWLVYTNIKYMDKIDLFLARPVMAFIN